MAGVASCIFLQKHWAKDQTGTGSVFLATLWMFWNVYAMDPFFFGKFLFCGSFPRIKGTTVFGPCLCPSYGVESHIPLWAAWWKFKTCQSELFVSFREGFHVPTRFQLQSDNTVKDSCMQKHFFGWEGGLMCLIMDCICIIKNGLVLSWKDVSEHPRRFETGMQADWWWHCAKTVYSRFAITATCQWVTPMRTWMLCCR